MKADEERRQAQEIKKLPRSVCKRCGLEGPKPMVNEGQCVNEQACERRMELLERSRRKGRAS